jgi:hypothetical protein
VLRRPVLRAALLAAATALPLLLGAPAPAAVPRDGGAPVPESELVPGLPLPPQQPYQRGTPDQGAWAPRDDRAAPPGQPGRTPGPEYAAESARIEYVPRGEELRADDPRPKEPRCSKSTGPYQREVEGYLGLEPDGRQSPADCKAIQAYQTKAGIHPNSGFAGPVTWKVLTLEWARAHPGELRGCPAATGVVGCLDLNRQIMWVRDGDRIVFEPVAIRSGKPGYATRTGAQWIYKRVRHEHSRLYDSPMPFSQYFNGGQALHGVYDDLYVGPGSHGCVNLAYEDAERLWKVLGKGDRLHIWGKKPNR